MQDAQQKIVTGLLVHQLCDGKLHHPNSLLARCLLVPSMQVQYHISSIFRYERKLEHRVRTWHHDWGKEFVIMAPLTVTVAPSTYPLRFSEVVAFRGDFGPQAFVCPKGVAYSAVLDRVIVSLTPDPSRGSP